MPEPHRWLPPRFRGPLQVLVGATAFSLLATAWVHAITLMEGRPSDFPRLAFRVTIFWYLWAAFLGPVLWMARRYPIERGRAALSSVCHLVLAVLLSVAHTVIRFGLHTPGGYRPERAAGETSLLGSLQGATVMELPLQLFIYGCVLVVAHLVWYSRRLRERELTTSHLRGELARAQVRALRMQLNPHFLFNALNSIAMLVRDDQRDEAVGTIAGLSDLLRYALEDPVAQEVPLAREIDFVERYLTVERVRFPDRLHVSVDAAPGTLDALVPTLVLQPLVENAVRHGVARSATATTVSVSARREADRLVLRVQDDGPGFREQVVGTDVHGVGIANTRERLEHLYGRKATLERKDGSPTGAVMVLSVPFHTVPFGPDREDPQ